MRGRVVSAVDSYLRIKPLEGAPEALLAGSVYAHLTTHFLRSVSFWWQKATYRDQIGVRPRVSSLLDRPRILFADLVRACKTDRRSLKSLFARHGVTIDAPGTKLMGVYTVELRDKMGLLCDSLEDVEARRARKVDAAPEGDPEPDPA